MWRRMDPATIQPPYWDQCAATFDWRRQQLVSRPRAQGAEAIEMPAPSGFCPACGVAQAADARFCAACGHDLKAATAAQPAAVTAAGSGQASADGRWWWDGARWLPMPPAQAAPAVGPATAAGSGQASADGRWWWDGRSEERRVGKECRSRW